MTEVRKLKIPKQKIDWLLFSREKIPWDWVTFFILGILIGMVF